MGVAMPRCQKVKTLKSLITEARLKSVAVMNDEMLQKIAAIAQKEYDAWAQNEEGYDEELGSGGICHLIAEELAGILSMAGIEATTVSSCHEQHVYVVAKFREGVYQIDVPYHTYERGGGFTWKKLPGIVFDTSHVSIHRIDGNPRNFKNYIDIMEDQEINETDEDDYNSTAGLRGEVRRLEIGLEIEFPQLADLSLVTGLDGEELHLNSIRVKPNERGKGIGEKVMDRILKFADEKGLYVTLKPVPERGYKEKLHKFYKRFGFYRNVGRKGISKYGGAFGVYWIRRPVKRNVNEGMVPKSASQLNKEFRLNYTNWGASKTIFPRLEEIMRNPIFLPAYRFTKMKKVKSWEKIIRYHEREKIELHPAIRPKLERLLKNDDLFSMMTPREFFFTVKFTTGASKMANGMYKNPLLVNLLRVKYPDILADINRIKSDELLQIKQFVHDKLKGKIDDTIIDQMIGYRGDNALIRNVPRHNYPQYRHLVKQANPELADWLDYKLNYHEPRPIMELESPHEEAKDTDIKRGYLGTAYNHQVIAYDQILPNVIQVDHSELPQGRSGSRFRYFVQRPWNTILWNEFPPSPEDKALVVAWLEKKGITNPRDIGLNDYNHIYNRPNRP